MQEVVIVGGGVIGLLTARELLSSGASVTLLERGLTGSEASWAGGGIISPLYPWTYSDSVTTLANWAQQAYPILARSLKEETGIDPEINPCGLIVLDDATQEAARSWAQANHKVMSQWSVDQVLNHEPHIGKAFVNALWLPNVSSIRNPRLVKALRASLQNFSDFRLWENYPVNRIEQNSDGSLRVHGSNPSSYLDASKVIVCAGAWSKKLLETVGADIAVEPARGQMLLYNSKPGLINSILLHDGKYLIPRKDGRILVGSTLEFVGFEKQTTATARQTLHAKACELVPELAEVAIEAHWCGLRPSSPDGIPYIGAVPNAPNLFVNAGHFRNGLVLAPASARLMRDLVLGFSTEIDPGPYEITAERSSEPH